MSRSTKFGILLLLIVAVFATWNLFLKDKNQNEKIAVGLYESKTLTHNYDSFLRYCFNETIKEMKLPYRINVNGRFNKNNLNIYVVNFDSLKKTTQLGFLSIQEFRNFAENNFIAIPPNMVVIDNFFLSYLILNCFNEEMGFYQAANLAVSQKFKSMDDLTDFMALHSAIGTYLSINNYNLYKSKRKDEISIDSLANRLINSGVGDSSYYESYIIYLLPIISHELAHIKYHDNKQMGWVDFKKLLNNQLSVYREEQRADELSYQTIKNYLENNRNRQRPSMPHPLISFCRTMKNMVLTDTYHGFRGIDPENLIVTLEQKEGLTKEELQLPFQYIERVARGYENAPPPMTEEEFHTFLLDLNKSGSNIAHRHMLQRCRSIMAIAESKMGAHMRLLDGYLKLLTVNSDNKHDTDSLFLDNSLTPSHLTQTKVLNYLRSQVNFRHSINYENNHIQIGFLANNGGYIELHGADTNNLTKVVLVVNTRGQDGSLDTTSVKNLTFFMRFTANLFDDDNTGLKKGLEAHARIRNKSHDLPTFFMNSGDNIIKFTPLNNSTFFRVEASDFHNF